MLSNIHGDSVMTETFIVGNKIFLDHETTNTALGR